MRFENVNGDDILIYPGVAVMPRADGAFALVDLRELEVGADTRGFVEDEGGAPRCRSARVHLGQDKQRWFAGSQVQREL